MLKNIGNEDLDAIVGGITACEMAGLPAQNRRNGLQLAQIAYSHARSQGMSARQFNSMGWREYARQNCIGGSGVGPVRRGGIEPRAGRGVIVPVE